MLNGIALAITRITARTVTVSVSTCAHVVELILRTSPR